MTELILYLLPAAIGVGLVQIFRVIPVRGVRRLVSVSIVLSFFITPYAAWAGHGAVLASVSVAIVIPLFFGQPPEAATYVYWIIGALVTAAAMMIVARGFALGGQAKDDRAV